MSAHARLSPSSAHRWMACPASVLLESGMPDTSSEFADEGTAAHELASMCLSSGNDTSAYLGRVITVKDSKRAYEVTADMAGFVQVYVDNIRGKVHGGDLMVEQRVDFSTYVGVPGQFGTADAIILSTNGSELDVDDLKYGRGVRVDAFDVIGPCDGTATATPVLAPNPQLALYALGAYEQFSALGDIETVRISVHQPRLEHISTFTLSVSDLLAFGKKAKAAAEKAMDIVETGIWDLNDLNPGDKQCKFCKAKTKCPKLAQTVAEALSADFDVIESAGVDVVVTAAPDLAYCMSKVELVEQWCKAVRAETERQLLAGTPVPGWKLVQGKQGNRAWVDEAQAEATLKTMRVKHEEMYDYKVISPTSAEKLFKAKVIGPRQWPALQQMITRAAGKPSVAPESDKRAALVLRSSNDFEAVDEGADLV